MTPLPKGNDIIISTVLLCNNKVQIESIVVCENSYKLND